MSVDGLAAKLRTKPGARHVVGAILASVDATHATVDLGSRVVTATCPAGLGAPVGARVRVCIEGNTNTVTAILADTGRVAFTTSPTGTGWYERIGRRVDVCFATTSSLSASGTSTVTTLPAEVRPPTKVPMACGGGTNGDRQIVGTINENGEIRVRNVSTVDVDVYGYASYLLA